MTISGDNDSDMSNDGTLEEEIESEDDSSSSTSTNSDSSDQTTSSDDEEQVTNVLDHLIRAENWEEVLKRLKTKEGGEDAGKLLERFGETYYPIHTACEKKDVPLNVMTSLLEAYPNGIQKRLSEFNSLPIHIGIQNCIPFDIIKVLIDAYPEGLKKANDRDDLPVHEAAYRTNSIELISYLIQRYPKGLQRKNKAGDLPLHDAASANPSVEIFEKVYKAYPEGMQQLNYRSQLPLHCAALHSDSADVVQALLKAFPEGVKHNAGPFFRLPIHEACLRSEDANDTENIFKLLINAYPESIILTCLHCNSEERTEYYRPLEIADMAFDASEELVAFLKNAEEMFYISLANTKIGSDTNEQSALRKKRKIKN